MRAIGVGDVVDGFGMVADGDDAGDAARRAGAVVEGGEGLVVAEGAGVEGEVLGDGSRGAWGGLRWEFSG